MSKKKDRALESGGKSTLQRNAVDFASSISLLIDSAVSEVSTNFQRSQSSALSEINETIHRLEEIMKQKTKQLEDMCSTVSSQVNKKFEELQEEEVIYIIHPSALARDISKRRCRNEWMTSIYYVLRTTYCNTLHSTIYNFYFLLYLLCIYVCIMCVCMYVLCSIYYLCMYVCM